MIYLEIFKYKRENRNYKQKIISAVEQQDHVLILGGKKI